MIRMIAAEQEILTVHLALVVLCDFGQIGSTNLTITRVWSFSIFSQSLQSYSTLPRKLFASSPCFHELLVKLSPDSMTKYMKLIAASIGRIEIHRGGKEGNSCSGSRNV